MSVVKWMQFRRKIKKLKKSKHEIVGDWEGERNRNKYRRMIFVLCLYLHFCFANLARLTCQFKLRVETFRCWWNVRRLVRNKR